MIAKDVSLSVRAFELSLNLFAILSNVYPFGKRGEGARHSENRTE